MIGNPPYGIVMTMAVQFYKKAIKLGDYIVFILPISQFNNNIQMYEFDLIHSELISNKGFINLDKRVKLCFNIYKRNENGENKKPDYKLKDVVIKEYRKNNIKEDKIIIDYDIRICGFGWNIGKEVEYSKQYSSEYCIKINNELLKDKIITVIKKANWRKIYPMTGTERIKQWQIYKYIKEQIPEIN